MKHRLLFGCLLSGLLGCSANLFAQGPEGHAEQQQPAPQTTIIHAGQLLAVPGEDPLENQSVIIEGNRIVAVQSGFVSGGDINKADARIIDLADQFVLPGFMDMHVHLAASREEQANSADFALAGVINAKKTLMAGYTTVRDLGADDDTILKLRDAINEGAIEGPRIFAAGRIIDVGSGANGMECNGSESCRKMVRDLAISGVDQIKIYASCSGSQLCSGKDNISVFFEDELNAIMQAAKIYNLKVAAHSHPTQSAAFILGYDIASIEHGAYIDAKAQKTMKKKGVFFVPTTAVLDMLEMFIDEGAPGPMLEHNKAFHTQHPKTIMSAYKNGVKMATGSDAGIIPHGRNFREIQRLVEYGIPASEVLKMATTNAAELIDQSDNLGTIESQKIADIIALPSNPLEDISVVGNVVFVMKEGQIYKQ